MDELDLGSTIKGFVAGQKVFGRYTLQRMLGRGGMGVVWLAKDESLEREVALKFLPEVVASDPRAVDDLKRETRRSLKLTHPHIVRIYDFIEDARTAAIAMEFIAGETLAKRALAQPERIFSPKELQPWLEQLCGALDYAHGKAQVVHRDLKPANLMLDERGDLKIADFGIAASVSDSVSRVSAQAGSSGTPVYMSPQQMMGEKPAITDDVYAIGATLYELLTGKPPFHSGNVFLQVQSKVPPSIAARREELGVSGEPVPPNWEETIAACLAKDPKDRPQSAGEVVQRLNGVGRPSPAAAAPGLKQAPAKSSAAQPVRAPAPVTSATPARGRWLVAAVALTAAAAAGWFFGIHRPEQARLAELRRVEEARRAEAAAAAREQAEREQREYAIIAAKIDSVVDGSPAELRAQTETAVRAYLQSAPERYRTEIEARWSARSSAWEAARLAAARGGVIVRSNPPGAEVTVGSIGHGASPLTVRDVRLGSHPVRIRAAGYEDWSGEVEVKENAFAEVDAALVRSTGTLAISSEPAGVEVEIAAKTMPPGATAPERRVVRTPAELTVPTGTYELTFRRAEWPHQTMAVTVDRNGRRTASAEFVPGSFRIESTPEGAEVVLNGRVVGRTPLTLSGLVPGKYEPEIRLKGHKPQRVSGEVRSREETRLAASLEELPIPKPGQRWTIPDLGLEMIPIAPGTFQMGSASGGYDNERPVTRVTISRPFWLGKTEVTQAQYEVLMGNNPSHFKGEDRPVESVSWDDAMSFARKLTERERAAGRLPDGYEYTLPTEAQWEYACRAGTTGDYAGSLDPMGWYDQNSGNQTQPVGGKQPNAWGLYDMHGNVWEWCRDWYGNYAGGSVTDPTGLSSGTFRVDRGGGWNGAAAYCRSAGRGWYTPGDRNTALGVRLALSSVR